MSHSMFIRNAISVATISCAIAAFGAVAACSDSSTSSTTDGTTPGDSPFVGSWTCSGAATITHTKPPEPDQAGMDQSTLTITADGSNLTVVHMQQTDTTPCVFHWTADGDQAVFVLPQTCPKTIGGQAFTASYRSGSAKMSGANISIDRVFDLRGTMPTDAGAQDVEETITANATICTRM